MRQVEYIGYANFDQSFLTNTHPHYQSLLNNPPERYTFTSNPSDTPEKREKYTQFMQEIFDYLKQTTGYDNETVVNFINEKQFNGLFIPDDVKLCFAPTQSKFFTPHTWITNIEDLTTLYTPHLKGATKDINFRAQPWFRMQNALLRLPNCKLITTHVHSTIKGLKYLWDGDQELCNKLRYLPLAFPKMSDELLKQKKKPDPKCINFMFTNSYGGVPRNFELRGGFETLRAFMNLEEQGITNWRLQLTGSLSIQDYHKDIQRFLLMSPRVDIKQSLIEQDEFHKMLLDIDVFVVPAMRIHTISMTRSSHLKIIPLVSDGWAFDEFIKHDDNGFVVKGHKNYTSWTDENGVFRDNYAMPPSEICIENLTNLLKELVQDIPRIERVSQRAYEYALEHFDIDKRNKIFAEYLDEAGSWNGASPF